MSRTPSRPTTSIRLSVPWEFPLPRGETGWREGGRVLLPLTPDPSPSRGWRQTITGPPPRFAPADPVARRKMVAPFRLPVAATTPRPVPRSTATRLGKPPAHFPVPPRPDNDVL